MIACEKAAVRPNTGVCTCERMNETKRQKQFVKASVKTVRAAETYLQLQIFDLSRLHSMS